MEEYVSKIKLHEIVDYYLKSSNGAEHYAYNIIKNEISAMPAEDVAEAKHGHWIDHYTDIVCSECGAEYSDEIVFMNKDFACSDLNFCPNCGADMRSDENE